MPLENAITDPLTQFAVLVSALLLVQVALERVFVPALLGLLLLGMLLGPGGAAVLPREPVVELFGQIGLIYIMFLAGLEIDLSVVCKHKGETIGFGSLAFLLTLLLGATAAFALGFDWPGALMLGTLLSSHTLVAYPVLKRLQLLGRRPVVAALGGTVLTDTLALVLLAILLQLGGDARGSEPWWLPLVLLAVLTALSVAFLPTLARALFRREWVSPAEKALFALFVLLALASTAEWIGTEKILGAFLAGLCLNQALADNRETRQHVEFVGRMLFVPCFFVSTGMLLELDVVFGEPQVWGLAALLCGVVVVGKAAAAWLIGARYRYSRHGRLLMLSLTMPQAAATLAITVAANEVGLLDAMVVDAVIIVILLTCAAGPLLTAWIGERMRAQPAIDGGPVNQPLQ